MSLFSPIPIQFHLRHERDLRSFSSFFPEILDFSFSFLIVVGVVGNSLTYPPIVLPCGRVKSVLILFSWKYII